MEAFLKGGGDFLDSNRGTAWLLREEKKLEREIKKRGIMNGPEDNRAGGSGVIFKRKNPFIIDEAEVSGDEGSGDEEEEGEGDLEGFIDDTEVLDDSPPLNPYIGVVTQIGKTILKTHKWCDVCGVDVDYLNWSRHRKTRKHIKNNATNEMKTPPKPKPRGTVTVTSESEDDGVRGHVSPKKRKRILTEADKMECVWDHNIYKYRRNKVAFDEPPLSPVKETLPTELKLPKIKLKRKRDVSKDKQTPKQRKKNDNNDKQKKRKKTTTPPEASTPKKRKKNDNNDKQKKRKKTTTPPEPTITAPIGDIEIEMDLDVLIAEFRKGRRAGLGFADDKKTKLMSKEDRLCVRRLQDCQIDREVDEIRRLGDVCPLPKVVHSLIRGELRLPRMRVLIKEMEGKREGHTLCGDCWVWVEKKRPKQHKGGKKHLIAAGDMTAKECEAHNWLLTLKEYTDKYILGGKLRRNVNEEACPLQSFVVAREFGVDGRSTHLHVYLAFHVKVVREEVQKMVYDVMYASVMYHVPADVAIPKMPAKHFVTDATKVHCEIVRCVNATLRYITKEDYAPGYMNIDADLFHWNFKLQRIIEQDSDLDPYSYHFLSLPMQFQRVFGMRHSQYWNSLMAVEDQSIAETHITSLRKKFINIIGKLKERGVFLYGPPGTGKTVAALAYSGDCYTFNSGTNFPFTSYTREQDMLFDDIMPSEVLRHRQSLLQLTGGYRCPVEVKGGRIHSLRLKGKVFITSNYDIYHHEKLGKGEWLRRFAYIQVLKDDIRLVKGTRLCHGLERVTDVEPMACNAYQTSRSNGDNNTTKQKTKKRKRNDKETETTKTKKRKHKENEKNDTQTETPKKKRVPAAATTKKKKNKDVPPAVERVVQVEGEMDLDVLLEEFRKGRRAGLGFADDVKKHKSKAG